MNHCRPPQNWSLECGAVQIAARQKSSQTTDGQHLIRFCKVLYRTLVISFNWWGFPRNSGCADRNAAAAPETCGAAMLVPLFSSYSYPLSRWMEQEITFSPGATRSGFCRPSPVGPLEEKYEIPYIWGSVLCVEPTAMASSALAGSVIDRSIHTGVSWPLSCLATP